MSYIPNFVKNSDLTADTLNAIGNDIGVGVTVVQNSLDTLHTYGNTVLGNTATMNMFVSALMNRIARAEYTSRAYRSPLAVLKRGVLDFGETIEEIYVNITKGVKENEDPLNPSNPFLANMPDVRAAYHVSNVLCKYSTKIRRKELRKAFLSFSAIDDFIAKIVEALYNAHNWDEYLCTKYKLAQAAIDRIKAGAGVSIGVIDDDEKEAKAYLKQARKFAKLLPAYKTAYNAAGVHTHTPTENFVCFMTAEKAANIDVEALAAAYNLSYADFIGRVITIDTFDFSDDDKARICSISGIDVSAFGLSDADIAALNAIGIIGADENLLQIYDTVEPYFSENYNGSDDEWNYYLHNDQVFSISPFSNIVVIGSGENVVAVTQTLTNCTSSNPSKSVVKGDPFTATYTPADGHAFAASNVTVKIGGTTKSGLVTLSGKNAVVTIPGASVTGDIEITASPAVD